MKTLIAAMALVVLAGAADAATCPAAAPFAGFGRAMPATAAADAATGSATIRIAQAAAVALRPAAALRFAVAPGKAAPAGSHGGLVAFAVATPGRYRVGASGAVWIDVVADGRALPSVAHGHGPECGPVRKIVDFDLRPGRHLLQLSGSRDAGVTVMIAPAG
jgi:hypothetical protein